MSDTIIAGITIGDPNGIGPEIILKSFTDQRILEEITPVIYSPIEILEYYQKKMNLHLRYEWSNLSRGPHIYPQANNLWDLQIYYETH